ncbi:MAG TPA: hypothetical protein VFW68_05440 [Rhodocyclaceae bacterium]|nr:hypothetical protein [Rhodocyclaceae bacterium]
MKKILMASLLAVVGSSAFANPTTLTQGTASSVTTTSCPLLATGTPTLTVNLSKNNYGSYDCSNTTTNSIGIATASPNGKGFVFQGSSAGGQIQKNATTGNAAPTSGDVDSAATAGAASS